MGWQLWEWRIEGFFFCRKVFSKNTSPKMESVFKVFRPSWFYAFPIWISRVGHCVFWLTFVENGENKMWNRFWILVKNFKGIVMSDNQNFQQFIERNDLKNLKNLYCLSSSKNFFWKLQAKINHNQLATKKQCRIFDSSLIKSDKIQ